MSCSTQIIASPRSCLILKNVARQVLALLAVEPGRGLVEQEHARLQRQRARAKPITFWIPKGRADTG